MCDVKQQSVSSRHHLVSTCNAHWQLCNAYALLSRTVQHFALRMDSVCMSCCRDEWNDDVEKAMAVADTAMHNIYQAVAASRRSC
jgi:hypothetical protein